MTKDKTSIDKNKTSEQRKYNYCFEPKHEILLNIINIPAPLSLNFHNIFRITIEWESFYLVIAVQSLLFHSSINFAVIW